MMLPKKVIDFYVNAVKNGDLTLLSVPEWFRDKVREQVKSASVKEEVDEQYTS